MHANGAAQWVPDQRDGVRGLRHAGDRVFHSSLSRASHLISHTSRCRASSITASSSAPWIRRRGATSGGPRRSTHACGMPRRGWRGSAAPSSAPARRASTTTWRRSSPRSAGRVLPPRSPCTKQGGSARRLVLPHTFRAVDVRRRRAAVRVTHKARRQSHGLHRTTHPGADSRDLVEFSRCAALPLLARA